MILLDAAAGLSIGLAASIFGLGLRHGIDWDHVAAISDITGSQTDRRRSLLLATLYALGHAVVVFALGVVAIAVGARVPESLDAFMGRVVGVTLIALGAYVLVNLARHGREARLQSRWMLLIAFVRRLVRSRRASVVVEHEHEHDDHHHAEHTAVHPVAEAVRAAPAPSASGTLHRHRHRHMGPLPDDPFASYGARTCFAIGMLHGIGAETPSQVLLLVTAAGVAGTAGGIGVLVVFLAGLLCANTAVAVATTLGFRPAGRGAVAYLVFSAIVGVASIVLGTLFLLGHDTLVPALGG